MPRTIGSDRSEVDRRSAHRYRSFSERSFHSCGVTRLAFATPRSPGIALAVTALGPLATQYDAEQMLADYTQELLAAIPG